MKKVILMLICVLFCATSWGQEQQDPQPQDNVKSETSWTNNPICQSCSMPMSDDLFGTNADGTANHEYCKYCYVNGAFTAPDMTMEEMIEVCVPFMVEQGMSKESATCLLKEHLPKLKRWQAKAQEQE